ncbi:MAG: hypothetical protein ACI4VT_02640 [Bacilli bacterium]
MKNLIFTFKVKNDEEELITSIVINSKESAFYVISRLVEEGLLKIKLAAIIEEIDVLDYDC